MVGQSISHYKILEKLGEGGMGVVYKALDTKLKRAVAIKFLSKHLSVHGEEHERFLHEAQSASALNHPNICVIHGIEEVNEETFIVMEYVDGMTLREWTRQREGKVEGYRKLGLHETINIATQIAEGIEKAHEMGIVHRDIKSENIMVTKEGRAKIMDFGLAKLRGVSKLTKTGSTVGTLAYMSPEQVEGLETDHRTDIFSFGVVLYETLSGRLPFQAAHEAALMYEVINVDPPSLMTLGKNVDAELDRIVMKCLEKDREQRYQSMREVAVDLKRYRRDSEGRRLERERAEPSKGEVTPISRRTPHLIGGVAVLLLLVIGLLAYLLLRPREESVVADKVITRITSASGLEDEPSWSPDGKFIAYTSDDRGNLDILVVPLGGGKPIRVVDSDADDAQPAWSPDGTKLAFVSARDQGGHLSIALGVGPIQDFMLGKHGDIFLIPAFGGTPVKLVENGYYPAWSPDGKRIVFQSTRGDKWDLWTIPAGGGVPKQLTDDEQFNYHPSWSPDGEWVVFGTGSVPIYNLAIVPASGGTPRLLTNESQWIVRPVWTPDGKYIIYSSNRSGSINLWKLRFSQSAEVGKETPRQVTLGQGVDIDASVSRVGNRLAYSTALVNQEIWELTISSGEQRQVTSETSREDVPRSSLDGKTLLITSNRGGRNGLWTIDLQGKILQQLSSPDADVEMGSWSPDGKKIAYTQIDPKGEVRSLFIRALGSLSATELITTKESIEYPIWSPDGRLLSFWQQKDQKSNVWIYDLEARQVRQVTDFETATFATWSPDGKHLTFQTQQGSVRHLWVIPSGGGTPRQITFGLEEHSHPQWSPVDPDVILFVLNHKNLSTVSVSTGSIKQLTQYVAADAVMDYPSWSPDGKKIYYSLSRKTSDLYTLENY